MATRNAVVSKPSTNITQVVWSGLLNGDNGNAVELFDNADYCVQLDGTFGTGGTIVFQGSNDGVTYFTLNDPGASAISKTAAALKQVLETPRYVRPLVTAGDGTTALVCTLVARRGR